MYNVSNTEATCIFTEDVKEFIRLLKEEIKTGFRPIKRVLTSFEDLEPIIDKLAGQKLVEKAK